MTHEELTSQLKQLSSRIEKTKDSIQTEEATKMSFIVPLFQILGYDVFNPAEFVPEFTADVGIKKGEKVDYAILINGVPTILIEAKWCGAALEKHDSQLFRYFATTNAKFAILTNGIVYRFYTDIDEKNKMDEKPFLEINLLDAKDNQVAELRKFCKDNFDVNYIFNSASELKYTNSIKQTIISEFSNPSDQFIRLIIDSTYDGVKTQKVVDDFKPIVKKSFTQYINELINDRLKSALESEKQSESEAAATVLENEEIVEASSIVTTEEELQAFYIIRSILAETIPLESITFKDTESYFGILYENNTRKWICRIKFGERSKNLILPDADNKPTTMPLEKIEDLYSYKQSIIDSANRFISQ